MTACTRLRVSPLTLTAAQLWESQKQLMEKPVSVRVYVIQTEITLIYLNITFQPSRLCQVYTLKYIVNIFDYV